MASLKRIPLPLLLCPLLAGVLVACGDKDDSTDSGAPSVEDDTGAPDCEPAEEVCDGEDNDCDGEIDEDDAVDAPTWYADGDGDGFGAPDQPAQACEAPEGFVEVDTDCDDDDDDIHPEADERCETAGIDDDCDGEADEDDAVDALTWHADADTDGYGDPDSSVTTCAVPSGYVEDASDCDDADPRTYPGATELCDGKQTDCDDGAWTSDAGLAHFEDGDGLWTDVSAELGAGSSEAPAEISLEGAGTLHVCGGTWPVSLDISADVRVVGEEGMDDVVLSGGGVASLVQITEAGLSVALEDLTLADGLGESSFPVYPGWFEMGGGIGCMVDSEVSATRVRFQDNHADSYGAAVALYDCDLTWSEGDLVTDTTTTDAFSIIEALQADVTIRDSDLSDFAVRTDFIRGEGEGSVTIEDSTFTDIDVDDGALVVLNQDTINEYPCGSATLRGNTFSGGRTGYYGSVYVEQEGCSATIEDSVYDGTSGNDSVVATVDDGSLSMTGVSVTDSTATEGPGLAHYGGESVIEDGHFEGNEGAYSGVVVFESGTLEIYSSSFLENTSSSYATITAYNDPVTIDGSTFEGNMGRYGGAIYAGGQFTLSNTSFTENSTNTSGGGAIFIDGTRTAFSMEATNIDFVDNDPDDIWNESKRLSWTLGTGVDFTCDKDSCE